MNYPLTLRFKIFALAPQIRVLDSTGATFCYVRQKMLKLKEHIEVFSDTDRQTLMANIHADRIIDFSATYRITSSAGQDWGCIRRRGMRSLWRAHYEIVTNTGEVYTLREENPWVKVADGIFGQIPILGMLTGLLFNPSYLISKADGTVVYRLKKQAHLLEGVFTFEKCAEDTQDILVTLSVLMMILLERQRG
jgi:uncharacterized protein YxjI